MVGAEIYVLAFVIGLGISLGISYLLYRRKIKKILKNSEGGDEHDRTRPRERVGEDKAGDKDVGEQERGLPSREIGGRESKNEIHNGSIPTTRTDEGQGDVSTGKVKNTSGTERDTKEGVQLSDFTPI